MDVLRSELKRAFLSPAPYLSWAALTVILVLSGPFDTYSSLPLYERSLLFGSMVAVCMAWGVAARVAVQWRYPSLGYWTASALVILGSALLLTLPLHAILHLVEGEGAAQLPDIPTVAGLIVVFGFGVAAVRWALTRDLHARSVERPLGDSGMAFAPTAASEPARPMRLMERLPEAVRGDLVRITARDHYVEVVTENGSASVLLRLSDAVAETGGVDGLRVHRSHWIALRAVTGAEKRGDKVRITLADGSDVPVSRNYLAAVQARGLV